MKRVAVSIGLLISAFACSGAPVDTTAVPGPRTPQADPISPSASPSTDLEVPDDPYLAILPTESFPDIETLCAKQEELILPRLAEMTESFRDSHWFEGEEKISPSCKEIPDVLRGKRVELGPPFQEVKAIRVQTGDSTDTFLVVRTNEGWSAVRDALLKQSARDPGCSAIERENAIDEVRFENGSLVVLTAADRGFYYQVRDWDPAPESMTVIYLTYARACRFSAWGSTCSPKKTIAATLKARPLTDPNAPTAVKEVFSTTFAVSAEGAIDPATPFDEEHL